MWIVLAAGISGNEGCGLQSWKTVTGGTKNTSVLEAEVSFKGTYLFLYTYPYRYVYLVQTVAVIIYHYHQINFEYSNR